MPCKAFDVEAPNSPGSEAFAPLIRPGKACTHS